MVATLEKTEERVGVNFESGGKKLFGVLHRPVDVETAPVVTVMHGFASSKHGSNRCYVYLAEALSQMGIATLRFDFRGSGDSEGSLSEISLDDLVADGVAAVEALEAMEGVDAERVGLFGASLGGAITVLSQALHGKAKALALWAPVASGELWYRDFLTQHPELANKPPSEALGSFRGVSLNPQFREQFGNLHAYKVASRFKVPLLHMHGEKDSEISVAHQEAYKKACSLNEGARFMTYPDAHHSLGFSPFIKSVLEETVNWFAKHL